MRFVDYPEFETIKEEDEFWEQEDLCLMDYKPFDILESVDRALKQYGLEVIIFGDDIEAPFKIGKIKSN